MGLDLNALNDNHFAVIGDPIKHSLSPTIHNLFAEQTDLQLSYDKWHLDAASFKENVRQFFQLGGVGLNVTSPHKQLAYEISGQLTERAQLAGAVNTLYVRDNTICGESTDGPGLVNDLLRMGWPLNNARLLLIGAGGAVRGTLQALIESGVDRIAIFNRTASKAESLCSIFASLAEKHGASIATLQESISNDDSSGESKPFDLIINATSASLSGETPAIDPAVLDGAYCYDMFYAAAPTPFLRWAAAQGAKAVADGLGMLVGQAAESFQIWHQLRPDVEPVLLALRDQLADSAS